MFTDIFSFGQDYSLERWRRFEILCCAVDKDMYPTEDASSDSFGPASRMSSHVDVGAQHLGRCGAGSCTIDFRSNARNSARALGHSEVAFQYINDLNVMCFVCEFCSLIKWVMNCSKLMARCSVCRGVTCYDSPGCVGARFQHACGVAFWLMVITPRQVWQKATALAEQGSGLVQVRMVLNCYLSDADIRGHLRPRNRFLSKPRSPRRDAADLGGTLPVVQVRAHVLGAHPEMLIVYSGPQGA